MLVLGRKRSETLVIGEGIRITVVKVERNHVRIGIDAPGGVSVLRSELLEKRAGGGPVEPGRTAPTRG